MRSDEDEQSSAVFIREKIQYKAAHYFREYRSESKHSFAEIPAHLIYKNINNLKGKALFTSILFHYQAQNETLI